MVSTNLLLGNIKTNQASRKNGFTLVELMIAMLISGIVISSIYTAFRSQQRSYLAQEQVSEMQQNLRAGIGLMTREIRMAGYDPYGDSGAAIINATSTNLQFTLVADNDGEDNNNDGTQDEEGELQEINYEQNGTNINRTVDGNERPIIEDTDGIEFFYHIVDGNKTLTPDADDIRAVEISILARAGKPDRSFNNNKPYCPASNPSCDSNGTTWGPYNDHYRRRFQTITVQCRNMGL